MFSSSPISPATSPSGCALNNRRTMRNRGSAPIAENISAQRVISAESSFLAKRLLRCFHTNRNIEDAQQAWLARVLKLNQTVEPHVFGDEIHRDKQPANLSREYQV